TTTPTTPITPLPDAGAPIGTQPCTVDTQCITGQICAANPVAPTAGMFCIPGCRTQAQCLAGQQCTNSVCTGAGANTPCTGDAQCFLGNIGMNNMCTPGCHTNNDCPANGACTNGQCAGGVPTGTQCQSNLQCPQGTLCNLGVCTGQGQQPPPNSSGG